MYKTMGERCNGYLILCCDHYKHYVGVVHRASAADKSDSVTDVRISGAYVYRSTMVLTPVEVLY